MPLKPYVHDETQDFLFLRTYNKVVCLLLLLLLLFYSRGGLQVLVELTFKEAVSTEYAIAALKKAAESETLATFQIKSSSIITTRENKSIETIETTAGTSSTSTGI